MAAKKAAGGAAGRKHAGTTAGKASAKASGKTAGKAEPSRGGAGRAGSSATGGKRQEAAPDSGIVAHLREDFASVRDAVVDELDRAIETARQRLGAQDGAESRRLGQARDAFRRHVGDVRERVSAVRERAAEASKRVGGDDRVKAAADAGLTALHGLASALRGVAERVEGALDDVRAHSAGETVVAGGYACRGCGEVTVLAARGALDPCDHCGEKRFRKVS